jgi:WD40 repeat protein
VAVNRDGTRLAGNSGGGPVRIWDTATRKEALTLTENRTVHQVAFSPDGTRLGGAAGSSARLWEAASGKLLADFEGPDEALTSIAFNPDGTLLAGASSAGLSVWLWRVADGEPVLLIPDALDNCTIEAVAFHPRGELLAVGGIDWLATGGSDGALSLWNTKERCEVATFLGGCRALAFHPSGQFVAAASLEQSVLIWNLDTQGLAAELLGHDGNVTAVAYSPDGRYLATGGEDHFLRLWSDTGDELTAIEVDSQIQSLAFAPDGRYLYSGNGNTTCSQFDLARLLGK